MRKDVIILSSTGSPARRVNDEGILNERPLALDATRDILSKFVRRVARNSRLSGKEEAEVEDVLTRAQRWGAVMLIDEADVYIKRRDDNITMNAVVGVFLRVLEYFNGLLFLTTNRVDDIDEAIVSRCIAMIKFHPPKHEDRCRIWAVMSEQFGLNLPAAQIEQLAKRFPTATGRDIKGLAKLVAKYCNQKQLAPDNAVFVRCSVFRGMEVADSADAG